MLKLVTLSLLAIVCVFADSPDIRRIDSGQVQGVYDTSRNIRYWKGIPFAGDTSGANRFSAPQPVQPWSGVRNCSDWAPGCRQIHHNPDVPDVQSEDCLNLNVYVPGATQPGPNLPVMIWIHGGAFSEGCNQGPFGLYDGGYIANRGNVVVVTINYRLGAFGFLVTDQLRGNFGFLDQRAAMQWVQRNIAVFGGDPNQVTLFGESAGAMSIGYHIVAPGSKGLFKRAILESNVNMLLHTVKQAQFYGESFCKAAGCGEKICNNTCLRALSDSAVVEAWKKSADDFMAYIKANWQHLLDGAVMQFAPIVDGTVIPTEVIAALQAGQFNPGIDVLEGQNTEDGQTFVYASLDKTTLPVFLYEAVVDVVFAPYGKQIIARYKDPAQKDGRWLLSEVVTDYLFRCSTQQFSMAAAKAGNTAWAYTYKHVFSASWIWKKFGLPDLCANHSCHMAEVPFIFHNEVHTADLNVTFTPSESAMGDAMIDYWTSFATYGNPNKSGRTSFTWPPYDPTQRKALLIDEQMAVEDNADLCSFWDKVGYSH